MLANPGIFFLVSSVLCSVTVSVLLKLARRHDIDVRQSIAVNYVVASLLCWLTLKPSLAALRADTTQWVVLLALGILLPSVFIAMARSVRDAGILRSDAAQRLSLFIPLIAAFALFDQAFTAHKGLAVLIGLMALFCLLKRSSTAAGPPSFAGLAQGHGSWLWPLAVWVGYGVIDIVFKQLARTGTAFASGLLASFVLAGILMALYLLINRTVWHMLPVLGGVLLGAFNFANIYTYIRAHQSLPSDPALVFSAMNIGVIAVGAVTGALVFRERLSALNLLGLALALAAIILMTPW